MADRPATLKDLFLVSAEDDQGEAPHVATLSRAVALQVKGAKIDVPAIGDALRSGLDSVLNVELSTILAGAWLKTEMLRDYRDKSLANPTETMTVALSEHTIQSTHRPSIDILVNNTRVDGLALEIGVEMVFEGLALTIRNGRVMAIRPGNCTCSGRISCKDITLLESKDTPVALPGLWSLGEGIVIPGHEPGPQPPAATGPAV